MSATGLRSPGRRQILRGAGAALALPWLESLSPPLRAGAAAQGPNRFVTIYVPNGMAMSGWTPTTEGALGDVPPILQPLAPHGASVRVLSGLSTLDLPTVPAYHAAASTKFLTATSPSSTRGAIVQAGISVDQVIARELGGDTPLPSLELALESTELVRVCDAQYSCAYQNTISWADPFTPLPMEARPRAVFERMFGDRDHTTAADRARALQDDRSLLDSVREGLGRLQRRVSASDRARLGEYLESIRGVERRIRDAEKRAAIDVTNTGVLDEPLVTFVEQYTLMLDLMVLAFHADLTGVCTLMVGCEASVRTYPEIGIPEAHHQMSHHQNRPEMIEKLARINVEHVKVLAYLLDRLRSTQEGAGTLLDRTVVLYGAGMSDSNLHRHDNLPILLAGAHGMDGRVHVRYSDGTRLANLHLTLLRTLGIRADRFGNSSTPL